MTPLQKTILEVLEPDFRYEQTDWIPSFRLMPRLLGKAGKEIIRKGIDADDVAQMLQELQSKGLVEYSPLYRESIFQGFTTRLTARGYNMLHYGRPSLVG
ncbi:MAG TPA: hypothetical protein VFH95_05775 [Candidatus Kapabacteria bacterium]|nr:hypothetical protein [Candidatus Kapabacteria bacterium]